MNRYFVHPGPARPRFWHVETAGTQLRVRHGQAGTPGLLQTKPYDEEKYCQAEAARLSDRRLREGYVEIADPGPLPTPARRPPAPPAAPRPALHLLPEKVAGRRIRMVGDFKKYRLGSKTEVRQLLEAAGATVLVGGATEPFDFVLGSYQFEGEGSFAHPVVFEEELCAPTAPPGPLANFKPRLWAMLRELFAHPLVRVTRLTLGQPAKEADFAKYEKQLGRPLPALLKEFYRQVGELRLFWLFAAPAKQQRPWLRPTTDTMFMPDAHGNHDGTINIFPLKRVLGNEWHDPRYCFDLWDNQQMFDFYSEYHMMAVELGEDDDPLLFVGEDHGVDFDDAPPIRLTAFLDVLLATYGIKGDRRTSLPDDFPVDLDNKAGLQSQSDLNQALDVYAYRLDDAPLDAPHAASLARRETKYFELLEYAIPHRPSFSIEAYYRHARPSAVFNSLLAGPRFQALRPERLRADIRPVETLLYINAPATQGTLAVTNDTATPVTVQDFIVQLWVVLNKQEVLLGRTDAAQPYVALPAPPKTSRKTPAVPFAPVAATPLPAEVLPGQTLTWPFAMQGSDIRPVLVAHGIGSSEQFHKKEPSFFLRLQVPIGAGKPLTDDYEVDMLYF